MYSSDELFQRSREGYFGVSFPSCEATRENEHQNNTWVSTETVRHESTYIIIFLTRLNKSMNDDKNDDLYTSSPCLARPRFLFCWWRHNQLLMTSQWPDNCVAITWIVISDSLDCDFIHNDSHGRSSKKVTYHPYSIFKFWIMYKCRK